MLLLLLLPCAAGAAHAETNAVFIDDFETAGACPPGRIRSTVMSWRYDGIGRTATDVTRAENIWGRSQAGMPTVPFPWLNYYAIFWSMPRNGYIAAVGEFQREAVREGHGHWERRANSVGFSWNEVRPEYEPDRLTLIPGLE